MTKKDVLFSYIVTNTINIDKIINYLFVWPEKHINNKLSKI